LPRLDRSRQQMAFGLGDGFAECFGRIGFKPR
jgi:hypothetical protein